jgi:DNA topoisomerase-6 subunit B
MAKRTGKKAKKAAKRATGQAPVGKAERTKRAARSRTKAVAGKAPRKTKAGAKGTDKAEALAPAATGETPGAAPAPSAEAAPPPPAEEAPSLTAAGGKYATAEQMAKAQRSISVSEFFAKNRHLLGFDNPRKALLTTVKEAVDNALDACEEAGILPRVEIGIEQLSETHFRVAVQDNGPGIVRKQIPNIFGKLLYGSKFHRLRMSRGQQGIGISAAGMYGVLTTGVPVRIISRTSPRTAAHLYELQIDTRKNKPDVSREDVIEWDSPHGTRVEMELEARYQRGRQSVDDYLEQTAIANPHVTLVYRAPDGRAEEYKGSVRDLPPTPKSIRPHPYGVELGVLLKMASETKCRTAQKFLTSEFSRISPRVAKEILERAGCQITARPSRLGNDTVKRIYEAVQETKIMAPATDCVVPIGQEKLVSGLKQVVDAAFYAATTRSPAVYRGNPFIIEVGLAYGRPERDESQESQEEAAQPAAPGGDGSAKAARSGEDDQQLAKLIRFANRVPLQYQQSACATYKSVVGLNWKGYGLAQGRGALPTGPLTVVVHMASVWVPFTSESKEAIASYPEILKEVRLGLQECGRKLATHIRKAVRHKQELKKRSYIERYIPAIGEALRDILELRPRQVSRVCTSLKDVLERSRRF